jgi:hypothetical protein
VATTGATLITELARRLRDSGNTAHTRVLLGQVLSHCQRAVNLQLRLVKATVTFTPNAGRTLYTTDELAADVGRIERIRALDRMLPELPWRGLLGNSATWYRDVGMQPRVWAQIGSNLFVLSPRMLVPEALDVVYTIIPADVADAATDVDLPDEWVPLVLDLAESVMLFRARLYGPLEAVMARLSTLIPLRPVMVGDPESS